MFALLLFTGVGDAEEDLSSPLKLRMLFNITVFQSGYDFRAAISVIFRSSFADLVALHAMESTDDDEEEEDDDLSSNEEEHVMQLTQEQWRDVFGTLNDLGALSSFEDCFADTLVEHIEKKVRKTATGKFEVQKLKSLEAWLGAVAIPWLSMALGRPIAEVTKNWLDRLEFHLFECFLQVYCFGTLFVYWFVSRKFLLVGRVSLSNSIKRIVDE